MKWCNKIRNKKKKIMWRIEIYLIYGEDYHKKCQWQEQSEVKWSGGRKPEKSKKQLDPVGSTVRYEMMKLWTGSV